LNFLFLKRVTAITVALFYISERKMMYIRFRFSDLKKIETMNTAEKKLSLLERILKFPDAQLEQLEAIIENMEATITEAELAEALLAKFAKPSKQKLDIEEIMKEQNYPTYDSKKAEQLVKEMNIQEPFEDLIKMI